MKCSDCGSKNFQAYNEESALMVCADCGQFYQIKVKEIETLRAQLDSLTSQRDELVKALESLTSICERVDSWESFPSQPLEDAYNLLTKIKESTK